MSVWDGDIPSEHDQLRETVIRQRELYIRLDDEVAELFAEHRPQWVAKGSYGYTEEPQDGFDPVGCVICYPQDGDWPCTSFIIAEAIKALIPPENQR